jgi:hypothetical protein
MPELLSLFDPALDVGDLDTTFVHIRDSEFCDDVRAYLDAAWAIFRDHADSNFATELRRPGCFQSRAWELRLAWTLRDLNLPFRGPKPGPDFAIPLADRTVYVEAVAPHATDSLMANYEAAKRFGAAIPDAEIILRYTGAIVEKVRKFEEYRSTGIVGEKDPYVIALSGANIPQSSIEEWPFPRILKPLFAIGEAYLSVPVDGSGEVTQGIHRREIRQTSKGSPVSCRIFLQDGHRELSAVVFAPWDIKNSPESRERPPGNDFLVIHNPYAQNPLPAGFLPRGQEWAVRDGTVALVSDWRSREAAKPDGLRPAG